METETDRLREIRRRLTDAFAPTHLEIEDQSARHAGHRGAKEHGGGHYAVTIQSAAFTGKSSLHRHRMIHESLGEMMQRDIHALSIKTLTPDESV